MANASAISTDAGRVAVRVTRTDEELMIARSVIRVLGLGAQKESCAMLEEVISATTALSAASRGRDDFDSIDTVW
jgi:hypothetical protein